MRIVLGACAALLLVGGARAQTSADDPWAPVDPLPVGSTPRPVALTRADADLTPGQEVGRFHDKLFCGTYIPITWQQLAQQFGGLSKVFRRELRTAGFKPDKEESDLFDGSDSAATDLQVGAKIRSVNVDYCRGEWTETLGVHWQVYSTLRRETVASLDTEVLITVREEEIEARQISLGQMAFAANVRRLLSDQGFRRLVTSADPAPPSGAEAAASQQPIRLDGPPKGARAIAEATGAVVAVFAGDGMGSGVLVSTDGYILTDNHVVAGAKTVKVRWSDGFETTAEVVRSDKRRDVALLKTSPHGRTPLALNLKPVEVGASVFAIGTPLDPKLQNTVTRGVVSGSRLVEGFRFLQSDAPVTHGNSGGPLLDAKGAVIGLTAWGIPPEEGSSLNFFIPIGDALDFLGLQPPA